MSIERGWSHLGVFRNALSLLVNHRSYSGWCWLKIVYFYYFLQQRRDAPRFHHCSRNTPHHRLMKVNVCGTGEHSENYLLPNSSACTIIFCWNGYHFFLVARLNLNALRNSQRISFSLAIFPSLFRINHTVSRRGIIIFL